MTVVVSNRQVDAAVQDQGTPVLVLKLCRKLGDLTLASGVSLGGRTVTLSDATGVQAGHLLIFKQAGRIFQATVLSVAGAPTLTLDSPFPHAFGVSALVCYGSPAMAVDGSSTPVVFSVSVPSGKRMDVTQVKLLLLDGTEMDEGKFGGITALTNGVTLRQVTPDRTDFLGNVKTNGDLGLVCSGEYLTKAPSGTYGFRAVCHLAGQENAGVVVRLNGTRGDTLELVVQDNLTDLTSMVGLVIGHEVED